MVHTTRRWSVLAVEDPAELAEKVAGRTWTLCTGWQIGDVLYLNDSFSEDGAAEYAAVDARTGAQFESITFGWCDQAKAEEYIRLYADPAERTPWAGVGDASQDWRARCEPSEGHRCRRCA